MEIDFEAILKLAETQRVQNEVVAKWQHPNTNAKANSETHAQVPNRKAKSVGQSPHRDAGDLSSDPSAPKVSGSHDHGEIVYHRGKKRENKKKKPSSIKKVMLREREIHYSQNPFIQDPGVKIGSQNGQESACRDDRLDPSGDVEEQHPREQPNNNEAPFPLTSDNVQTTPEGNSKRPPQKAHLPRIKTPADIPFPPFIDQSMSGELDETCKQLLKRLSELQNRIPKTDPKYGMRRRLVSGLRECEQAIRAKRVLLVIIAPDIEPSQQPGNEVQNVENKLKDLVSFCRTLQPNPISVVFALSRQKLSVALGLGRNRRCSIVAVYSVDGAYEGYQTILRLANDPANRSHETHNTETDDI